MSSLSYVCGGMSCEVLGVSDGAMPIAGDQYVQCSHPHVAGGVDAGFDSLSCGYGGTPCDELGAMDGTLSAAGINFVQLPQQQVVEDEDDEFVRFFLFQSVSQ